MKMKNIAYLIAGVAIGLAISVPAVNAAEDWYKAYKSGENIYVDGERAVMDAYCVNDTNYIKLRDVARIVGFEVYWDAENHRVIIERDKPYTGEPPVEAADEDNREIREEIIRLVNKVRAENGVKEVAESEVLMNAAQDYAATKPTAHDLQLSYELRNKYGCEHGVGENLAYGGSRYNADDIVNGWVNSQGHFSTLINESSDSIGIGYYEDNGVFFCIMLIGDCQLEADLFGNGHE